MRALPLHSPYVLRKTSKSAASFYEFDEYARLVEAAQSDSLAYLVVLLGGEAGLRCGEIMALEWTDIDHASSPTPAKL